MKKTITPLEAIAQLGFVEQVFPELKDNIKSYNDYIDEKMTLFMLKNEISREDYAKYFHLVNSDASAGIDFGKMMWKYTPKKENIIFNYVKDNFLTWFSSLRLKKSD